MTAFKETDIELYILKKKKPAMMEPEKENQDLSWALLYFPATWEI